MTASPHDTPRPALVAKPEWVQTVTRWLCGCGFALTTDLVMGIGWCGNPKCGHFEEQVLLLGAPPEAAPAPATTDDVEGETEVYRRLALALNDSELMNEKVSVNQVRHIVRALARHVARAKVARGGSNG